MQAWLLHSPEHSPAPPSRSCPFDPAALPISGAGKEKNQQSRFAGSQTASGGAGTPAEGGRRPAMVPRVARAARADSSGVTGAAAAVPERFLVRVPPAEPAGQAALASGPPGEAGQARRGAGENSN